MSPISGFSKLDKLEKIKFLGKEFCSEQEIKKFYELLKSFWHSDKEIQKNIEEFSENTISNFHFPYGIVPNLLLNGKFLSVPMVIEESSVVAACAKSAKFWMNHGGFHAKVIGTEKVGQVHFFWEGDFDLLKKVFESSKYKLLAEAKPITENMEKRGGGLTSLELIDCRDKEKDYFQLKGTFETCDAMGANFINSVLESLAMTWEAEIEKSEILPVHQRAVQIVMSILSNYTPDCRVKAWVECPVEELSSLAKNMDGEYFAKKFVRAVRIAQVDVNRATTHNKGIFNGIDAVVLATGNDFRAVEACGHTYAARDGQYRSLTHAEVVDGKFIFSIELPLALGTVGGLTSLHPLAKTSLEILDNPNAAQLMQIAVTVGLAQNFGALRSLVTTGIQKGHMKMHLMNILNSFKATEEERNSAKDYFADKTVSFNAVREFIHDVRKLT